MSTLASQTKEAPARDMQRWVTVYQYDKAGNLSATEFDAHATDAELAQALCDSNLPDCQVAFITAGLIGEKLEDITEDVAREIENVAERAKLDRWPIQNCAAALLDRFGFFNALEAA